MDYRVREQNELKPSGVEWLGDIPKDWDTKKIKHIFKLIKTKSYKIKPRVLSLTKKGIKTRDVSSNEGQIASTYEGYIFLEKNDFVLNPMDLISGYVDKAEYSGVISPAYISFKKKKNMRINLDYYKFYFQLHYHHNYLFPFGEGVSIIHRWTLKNEIFLNLPIIQSSKKEQDKIANFLSEKNKSFDDVILLKEELIFKLQDAKQSLISEVVTGKLKVTNINEDNWKVKKLGYIFKFKNGVNSDSSNYGKGLKFVNVKETINTDFILEKDIEGLVSVSDSIIKENSLKKGDVLFNRTSETAEELALSTIYYDDAKALFGGFVIRGRQITDDLDLDFKRYCFQSSDIRKQIISYGSGSIRKNIAQTKLKDVYLSFPNKKEQKQISKYLDKKCKTFDNTIEKTKQSIIKIKSAKESLISEAVTGKIEVL